MTAPGRTCPECSWQYVGLEFCPRCGRQAPALAEGVATTPQPVHDAGPVSPHTATAQAPPRGRGRVRAVGVFLTVLGVLAGVSAATGAAQIADLQHQMAALLGEEDAQGLTVHVLDGPQPVSGAVVEVRALDGTLLANLTTDGNGTAHLAPARAAVDVHVFHGKRSAVTRVAGFSGNLEATVDLQAPQPFTVDRTLTVLTWTTLGIVAATAGLLLVGGIATWRVRARTLGLAACGTAALFGLVATLALQPTGMLVFAGAVVGLFVLARAKPVYAGRGATP